MKVNEIFESIQGEGARSGQYSVFIRLSGCNCNCDFCDTDHSKGIEMTKEEIYARITQPERPARWIVWTGGEPTLQLTDEVVEYFHSKKFFQAIETNGTNPLPKGLNYIAISPKGKIHKSIKRADEIRCIYPDKIPLKRERPICSNLYLSPRFDGAKPNYEIINDCIKYIENHQEWNLSVQMHKLLNIR